MPRRPASFLTTNSETTISSPRVFGGGRVACRALSGEFDSTETTHSSTAIVMPTFITASTALKTNISIMAGGPFLYPDVYSMDFTMRYLIDGQTYNYPWVRRSMTFGEIPTDYNPGDTGGNDDAKRAWGLSLTNSPQVLNLHLSGIVTLGSTSSVSVVMQNNSTGLEGSVRYQINLTAISVAALEESFEI